MLRIYTCSDGGSRFNIADDLIYIEGVDSMLMFRRCCPALVVGFATSKFRKVDIVMIAGWLFTVLVV